MTDEMDKKIEEHIKGLDRDFKIDRLVDDVYNWDMDTLMDTCRDMQRTALEAADDTDINFDYGSCFDYQIEEAICEAEEAAATEVVETKSAVCVDCPMNTAGITHRPDCPDYKG